MINQKQQYFFTGLIFVLLIIFLMMQSYRTDSYSVDNLKGYALEARFTDIGGLGDGALVLLSGVEIGRVVERQFNADNLLITVVMDISSKVQLPLDSSIAVMSNGVFGGKYLSISPGADYDTLQAGDSFEYVNSSVDIMGIMEKIILSAERKVSQ